MNRKPKRVVFPPRSRRSVIDLLTYYLYSTGLTRGQLAEILGLQASHLGGILSGKNNPSLKLIKAMRKELQIDGNLLLKLS